MRYTAVSTLLLTALALPLVAAPGDPGKPAEAKKPAAQQGGGGHGGHRRHKHPWTLYDMERAEVTLWTSDLRKLEVPYDGHWAHLPKSGVDNYHAAVAVQRTDRLTKTVIQYPYRNGRPSGHSPSELLAVDKAPLEIVPELPREHYRYLTGEKWEFFLRLNGDPVGGAEVKLRTIHGSELAAITDGEGRVEFAIPDDFPKVNAGRRKNPQQPFIVTAELSRDGHAYQTTLEAKYRPHPSHWRSFEWGVATLGVGFFAGLVITGVGRGEKDKKEKSS